MIVSDESVRTSYIGSFQLISVGLATVVHFGDAASINARSTGLAVQRQLDNRAGGEVDYDGYTLFQKPFNIVEEESPDAADIVTRTVNPSPSINIGTINIIASSGASVIVAGNAMDALMESRLKHIRQYAYSLGSSTVPDPALSEAIQTAKSENSSADGETPSTIHPEPISTTRDK
ncbi:spore germination protein GerPE [Paenibacillus sp. D51F]